MRSLGIDKVRPLAGGFEAWLALGFPVHAAAVARELSATGAAG